MDGQSKIARKNLEVVDIITETADTKSFVLKSADHPIEYRSGQFLTFIFKNIAGEEVRRSYSISSSFELNEPLTITVKRIVNGEYSRYLHDYVKVGDQLQTIGASGFFVLPDSPRKFGRTVFMAAGSGITPVFALMKTVLALHPEQHVLLLYSNSDQERSIFYQQLKSLQVKYKANLNIEFLFSKSADVYNSRLTPESLENFMQLHRVNYDDQTTFYICGPPEYMRMITYRLTVAGASPSRIKKEIFHIQHPKIRPEPPDILPHTVTLMRNGQTHKFDIQYPVTILQASKLLGIHLPYSCETGQCGTCVAKCLQGTVWMAQNEVLLDEEIKSGSILTCTGYPVFGNVTISV